MHFEHPKSITCIKFRYFYVCHCMLKLEKKVHGNIVRVTSDQFGPKIVLVYVALKNLARAV